MTPSPLHLIRWTMTRWRGPEAIFSCSAPPGSFCHLTCSQHCGETIADAHPHELLDVGYCLAVSSLDHEWDPGNTYDGPEGVPLSSGPIDVVWNSELMSWTWNYPVDLAGN